MMKVYMIKATDLLIESSCGLYNYYYNELWSNHLN
jgi:hypothetical protein